MPLARRQKAILASLPGGFHESLGLDPPAALEDGVGHGLRSQPLVHRGSHISLHMDQCHERREGGSRPAIDRHPDVARVHVGKPEQRQHRLAVQIGALAHPQERLRKLVKRARGHVRHPIQPIGNMIQTAASSELGQLNRGNPCIDRLLRGDVPIGVERDLAHDPSVLRLDHVTTIPVTVEL